MSNHHSPNVPPGVKQLRKGECSFFLKPHEKILNGIQPVLVLGEEEALLLEATEDIEGQRVAGERWLVRGPCDFIPSVATAVVERRSGIPLDEGEGVYVQSRTTGEVRAEVGPQTLVLAAEEQLYKKQLPKGQAQLLAKLGRNPNTAPEKMITVEAPRNTAIQVVDHHK